MFGQMTFSSFGGGRRLQLFKDSMLQSDELPWRKFSMTINGRKYLLNTTSTSVTWKMPSTLRQSLFGL